MKVVAPQYNIDMLIEIYKLVLKIE